jgi:hypothetical protein
MLRLYRGAMRLEDGQHRVVVLMDFIDDGFFPGNVVDSMWICFTKDSRAYAVAGGAGNNTVIDSTTWEFLVQRPLPSILTSST